MIKKYISVLLIIILVMITSMTGCDENETTAEKPEDVTKATILKEFSRISEIPRNNGSDMTAISDYILKKANKLGLSATTDDAGNIMIEKPASSGYNDAPTTIMQTNMDMTVEASPSIIFDAEKEGITPIINENKGQITANRTSLGARSGLGMSTAFYILEKATSHGAIKAVFTADGEGSMSGARNIDNSFLEGEYLINLNNDIGESIETGSAYSSVLTCTEKINKVRTKNKYSFVLVADGFTGGDSGIGAQKNQGNPIMFLAEVLASVKSTGLAFELNDFSAGTSVSCIPETAKAVITVNDYEKSRVNSIFGKAKKAYLKEHSDTDPDAKLEILETQVPERAFTNDDADCLISFLFSIVDGKYNDKDHTTASSNVGIVKTDNNKVTCNIFIQSKLEEALVRIRDDHNQIAKISHMSITTTDSVKGFYTDKEAYLPSNLEESYKSNTKIKTALGYRTTRTELGFFQEKNPTLELVSVGTTVKNSGEISEYAELKTVGAAATAITDFLAGLGLQQ